MLPAPTGGPRRGLVAILGVPMVLGGTVIGVLFAADRRSRTLSLAKVSLLCAMAAHAVIAIDSANLLEETRSALPS
jgi:GAF domain-containing protein